MKISPHFTLKEFACTDGAPYPSNLIENRLTPLCEALEVIRAEWGDKALTITGGYRSEAIIALSEERRGPNMCRAERQTSRSKP